MTKIIAWRGTAAVLLWACLEIASGADLGLRQVMPTRIHIRLVDLAHVPEKVLTNAEAMSASVFRKASVELDFVECLSDVAQPCRGAPGEADFWLQILDRRPNHLSRDSTGFAILVRSRRPGDSYAAVSMPMAVSAARELNMPLVEILAAALTHEIGHLLLHSTHHSRIGVMKARIDRGQIELLERGELLFTSEEMARLVDRVGRGF